MIWKRCLLLLVLIFVLNYSCSRTKASINVLLITMDTTRMDYFSHLARLGEIRQRVPAIFSLVSQGVVFNNAVASINSTNPSHLSILTSQYPTSLGVHSNTEKFNEQHPTLAEILNKHHYRTGAVISAFHLGNPKFGILKGFQETTVPKGDLKAPGATNAAIRWLRSLKADPFFLWVHYFDPHAIYDPPGPFDQLEAEFLPEKQKHHEPLSVPLIHSDPFFDKTGFGKLWEPWIGTVNDPVEVRKLYAGEVTFMLKEIGRLLNYLWKSPHAGKTLVVAVADHGESLGEHQIYFDHMGLYNPQIRVPMVFHFPKQLQAGVVSKTVETIDIFPTVLDLLEIKHDLPIEGRSLLAENQPQQKNWRTLDQFGRVAIIENSNQTAVAAKTDEWKLILPVKEDKFLANEEQLFQLGSDRLEEKNVLAENPKVAGALRSILQEYLKHNRATSRPELTEEEKEQMKALGYFDH